MWWGKSVTQGKFPGEILINFLHKIHVEGTVGVPVAGHYGIVKGTVPIVIGPVRDDHRAAIDKLHTYSLELCVKVYEQGIQPCDRSQTTRAVTIEYHVTHHRNFFVQTSVMAHRRDQVLCHA